MGYYLCPFHELFPEQAMDECRVLHTSSHPGLPADSYALIESYCIDPDCDCRRVMLNVLSRSGSGFLAAISFGFDRDDEWAGPFLDPLNPRSEYADALLEVVTEVALSDPDYVTRLESHYRQVKEAVANPTSVVRRVMQRHAEKDGDAQVR